MKAVTYRRYGPPQVLEVSEVAAPEPGDDDILVSVRAAEATKADCELRSFRFAVKWFLLPLRLAVGIRRPRRPVLGGYFSGVVEATGSRVRSFSPGDEVFGGTGLRLGAYGEYLVMPASGTVALKPRNMSFEEAAAVPLGGLNALHFLRLAQVRFRDKVLVNGAGASIGGHAVQIARAMGGEVTAVDHSRKEEFARRMGAEHFLDYTQTDFTRIGRTWDVIFDLVPSGSYADRIRVLNPGGRYVTSNPRLAVMLRAIFTTRFTDKAARFAFARESADELRDLRDMIEAGAVAPIVDRVLPMAEAAEAHRLVEAEERQGAVVLSIG